MTCVSERFTDEWSCHGHQKDNDADVSVGKLSRMRIRLALMAAVFQKFLWVSIHGSSSMSDATAAEDAEDCSATSLMPESKKEEGKGEMGGAFSIPFSEQYINEHLPIEDLLVTVVGSTVSYPMRLMKSKDKQATFTTGWNKLVGDKLFELCDVCVFMFSENDAELTLSLELLNNCEG
ncbi:Os12g0270600 [Oryza sativa Japonica Group]|uniref:Os12g0270600 protein n=1 Tax=Oryza sativa subsp. japonica TaxID=39947 RepID=A0A0P0Y916_ORYSJ|nr:Os12g0270600 [Oryza sativa Japonica Group]